MDTEGQRVPDADDGPVPAVQPGLTPDPEPRLRDYIHATLIAVGGGALGIAGAALEEARGGAIFGAPVIEEILKPAGLYYLLARRPWLLRSRLFTALLTGLAGLAFGLVESAIYVSVYVPDHSTAFVIYRFTVTPAVHAAASFIVGLGISPKLLRALGGQIPFFRGGTLYFIAGIALHAAYNITAIALTAFGVIDIR